VRLEILMAVTMKIAVFWEGTPCNLVDNHTPEDTAILFLQAFSPSLSIMTLTILSQFLGVQTISVSKDLAGY
jgi:hypothetical protein